MNNTPKIPTWVWRLLFAAVLVVVFLMTEARAADCGCATRISGYPAQAVSWIFSQGRYTHDLATGDRVAQYAMKPPIEPLPDARAITSGYRRTRTVLRGADGSADTSLPSTKLRQRPRRDGCRSRTISRCSPRLRGRRLQSVFVSPMGFWRLFRAMAQDMAALATAALAMGDITHLATAAPASATHANNMAPVTVAPTPGCSTPTPPTATTTAAAARPTDSFLIKPCPRRNGNYLPNRNWKRRIR